MLSTPHYRIFLSNGKHPWSQLTAGQVFGEIRVLAKSRNRCKLYLKFIHVSLQCMVFQGVYIFRRFFKHVTSPLIRKLQWALNSSSNLSCFIILYRIFNGLWSLKTDWIFDWITRLRAWLHTRITCVTHYCFNVSLPANKIQTSFLVNRSRNISG